MALSTCFILLGFAFIYAFSGVTSLDSIYILYSSLFLDSTLNLSQINIGVILVFIGFLFKIGSAPLHNWSPAKHFGKMLLNFPFFILTKLLYARKILRVKLSNSGNSLKITVPNFKLIIKSGWNNYSGVA